MAAPCLLDVQRLALHAGGLPKGRLLFDGLTFSVCAGERWVVLGPNGAGKSSLLAALAGVFACGSGEISVLGRPLSSWRPDALADTRAWCPQFWADPFAATVLETVRLAQHRVGWWRVTDSRDDVDHARRVVDELDLTHLAKADVRTLSGGERQRVAVATAVLQGAPLLLLDEPASHLDLSHQQLLLGLLQRHAAGGGAVVVSLHDLNLAWDLATHAVLLDGCGGAIAGPREEVMLPAHLSDVFSVPIAHVEVCGVRRFWVGPLPGGSS